MRSLKHKGRRVLFCRREHAGTFNEAPVKRPMKLYEEAISGPEDMNTTDHGNQGGRNHQGCCGR